MNHFLLLEMLSSIRFIRWKNLKFMIFEIINVSSTFKVNIFHRPCSRFFHFIYQFGMFVVVVFHHFKHLICVFHNKKTSQELKNYPN